MPSRSRAQGHNYGHKIPRRFKQADKNTQQQSSHTYYQIRDVQHAVIILILSPTSLV